MQGCCKNVHAPTFFRLPPIHKLCNSFYTSTVNCVLCVGPTADTHGTVDVQICATRGVGQYVGLRDMSNIGLNVDISLL